MGVRSIVRIIRDTREQDGWEFPNMVVRGLPTGDYSLEGYEHLFVIERKGKVAEFARNIIEKRFHNELERLNLIPNSFVILEFTEEDIENFPQSSDIPEHRWKFLKIVPKFIFKKLNEFRDNYNIEFILAGNNGKSVALATFEKIVEKYGS